MRKMLMRTACLAALLPSAGFAATPLFVNGSIVVAVSGNGSGTGSYADNQASPLTLMQFNKDGSSAGASIMLTQTGDGKNSAISSEYGSSSEGLLQRSANGKSLTIMGYGINADTFNANYKNYVAQTQDNIDAGKDKALAQSTSIQGGALTAVARVVANITNDGVDTSTALYGVFDQNNPRSAATVDGKTFYVSGQGVSGDATGGVFFATKGASSATAITGLDTSKNTAGQDTRDVQIVNGQLYVSVDSKQGSGNNRDFVGTLGTGLPTDTVVSKKGNPTGPTMLPGFGSDDGKGEIALGAGVGNGLNDGLDINLSPEQYFFANSTTLYVADSGNPKNTSGDSSLGDGGLQKWVLGKDGKWVLEYTLADGLGLVTNDNAHGSSGLFGLAGAVDGDSVTFYATDSVLFDTDPTHLFTITDSLSATSGVGESFTTLATAAPDTKFMGVAFAPISSSVPEPGTYALMIGGFGLIGGAIRRRRAVIV